MLKQKLLGNVMSEIIKNRFAADPIKYYRKQINNTLIIANNHVCYIFKNTPTYNFLKDEELTKESKSLEKIYYNFDLDNIIDIKLKPIDIELNVNGKNTKCISFPELNEECYNTKYVNKFGKNKNISYCYIPMWGQKQKCLGIKLNGEIVGTIMPIFNIEDI